MIHIKKSWPHRENLWSCSPACIILCHEIKQSANNLNHHVCKQSLRADGCVHFPRVKLGHSTALVWITGTAVAFFCCPLMWRERQRDLTSFCMRRKVDKSDSEKINPSWKVWVTWKMSIKMKKRDWRRSKRRWQDSALQTYPILERSSVYWREVLKKMV